MMTENYFLHNGQKVLHGAYVTCAIKDSMKKYHTITDARVSINKNGSIYICQNEVRGANAVNLLGYEGSWYIGHSNSFVSMPRDVTDFRVVSESVDDYEVY